LRSGFGFQSVGRESRIAAARLDAFASRIDDLGAEIAGPSRTEAAMLGKVPKGPMTVRDFRVGLARSGGYQKNPQKHPSGWINM